MNDPNIRAPRLLERYREEMLVRRYAKRTITSYVSWVRLSALSPPATSQRDGPGKRYGPGLQGIRG